MISYAETTRLIVLTIHNILYNIYCQIKTVKELCELLDKKYRTKDVGTKKFIVGMFLDFKLIDSKTIASQVQEL